MKQFSIGEVARYGGVGVETIRFYEREGLIAEPPRKESGYRQYTQETVVRLRFIQRAKDLGFSLREIKELLSLRIEPLTDCADIQERAEAKVRDIEGKIQTLQRMKKALANLVASCPGRVPASDCPILDALEGSGAHETPISAIGQRTAKKRPNDRSSMKSTTASRRAGKGANHVPTLPR
ncbi:MAG: hypothetical protein A3F68_01705 [Acidobacteria bacterium RIFCSPLOWO2_12_FULL_54_10]|nr:MAG: hypothetical protein A3F68_01705 [Acidobacteria bacterium RIFCSPLOWO2_12_FULL_54_10]